MAEVSNTRIPWTIPIVILIALFALRPVKAQAQDGAPVADAGLPGYAATDPVQLDGTDSYDPDESGPLSYSWQQISGPSAEITEANTATRTVGGFVQTDKIEECEFELVVTDGELTSRPDMVKVIIVPDFGENFVRHVNPPFNPNTPTLISFGGSGGSYTWQPNEQSIGDRTQNRIEFHDGYRSDKKSDAGWPTFYGCGDTIVVYLSSVAPEYKQPIQIAGASSGGENAVDVGIRLNLTYRDSRYAVNRVTLLDASFSGRSYEGHSGSIAALIASSVDGEQCWLDNYVSQIVDFYPRVLNVRFEVIDHWLPLLWYESSWKNAELSRFNNGVVAGA